VLGGSLGAQALNETVPQALAQLPSGDRPEVRHQAGVRHVDAARNAYRQAQIEARVDAFVDDMAAAYAWADLVVCRAGALTIAELTAVGVAAILVPYPHAVDDHQTGNAGYLVDADAALLIPQTELTPHVSPPCWTNSSACARTTGADGGGGARPGAPGCRARGRAGVSGLAGAMDLATVIGDAA
jgi:UDP-N-acetylglucosamine:LPS N-acetylglucosamine transferase